MEPIKALNEIPTIAILYAASRLKTPSAARATFDSALNSKISVIRYDITRLNVDSIVNAANSALLGGGGVDGAIHRAAGPRLLDECERLGGCQVGSAKITSGYKLPAKKVIHAVGPIYWKEKARGTHESLLRGCYRRSLELAEENGCKSIAFAAISTGVYGYPSDEAAEHAVSEVRNYFSEGKGTTLDRVVFCNFLPKDENAYNKILPLYFPPEDAEVTQEVKNQEATKAKSTEKDQETELDDDWVQVDKDSIPKKTTVEDEEEESKT